MECPRILDRFIGMNHAPLRNFFANWLWWLASALAYNVARWVRVLALPEPFRTCRGKRLRTAFINVPARVVRTSRRIYRVWLSWSDRDQAAAGMTPPT